MDELGGADRVHVLGEFVGKTGQEAEVADPFGADLDTYRATYDQLSGLVAAAADRIVEDSGD